MKTNANIRLIELPSEEPLRDEEMVQALGGWNCDTYTKYPNFRSECHEWTSGACTDSRKRNYCNKYSIVKKK